MLSPSVDIKVKKINLSKKDEKTVCEPVAADVAVKVYVNNWHTTTLFSLPTQLRELGVGWILSHSVIESIDEIDDVEVKENTIKISCKGVAETRMRTMKTGDSVMSLDSMKAVDSDYRISAEEILHFATILDTESTLFRSTGGTHSAAIFHNEKLVAFAEDTGRHNAVDKVIGEAAEKRVDFSRCVLMSSGRQPADMVLKAANVGIPMVTSISGPLYTGIRAALKTGVTLICFVRDHRMNVYSYPERLRTYDGSEGQLL